MQGRTVHLVDLENVLGSGHLTDAAAAYGHRAYRALGVVAPGDLVIVGVSHHNLMAAWYSWPGVRFLARSGVNGADLALQQVMACEDLETRFGAAVLVSGDGGFAESVASLIGRGLPVGVIAPAGRVSAKLRMAANTVREVHFAPYATPVSA